MQDDPRGPAPPESSVPPRVSSSPEGGDNPFARIVGVLFSPEETFASIARRPDWLVPLLLMIIVAVGSYAVLAPKIDYEPQFRAMYEQNRHVPADQREELIEKSLEGVERMKVFGYVTPVLSILVLTLLMAGVFWGGLRAFGGDNSFKQTYAVTVYGWIPMFLKSVITTLIALPRSVIDARELGSLLKSNLGAFVDSSEAPVMHSLLSSVDLFNIWTIVLFAIGLAAISRFSRTNLAIYVTVLYLIVVAVKVGFAALIGGIG
jgi:hypothetical protein